MTSLAGQLRRSIEKRCEALSIRIAELSGSLGPSSLALSEVLELVGFYPQALSLVVEDECTRNPDPNSQIQLLRPLLEHLTEVRDFVDSWLYNVDISRPFLALLAGIETHCSYLGLPKCRPVVSFGAANNCATLVGNLDQKLFGPLGPTAPPRPAKFSSTQYVLIQAPTLEGSSISWMPLILGHELGHLAQAIHRTVANLRLPSHFDFAQASTLYVPGATAGPGPTSAVRLMTIAEKWATELLCDAIALRSFGASAVAALSEMLTTIGATDQASLTHPPGRVRIQLLTEWIGHPLASPRVEAIVEPWRDHASLTHTYAEQWMQFLVEMFKGMPGELISVVDSWHPGYDLNSREDLVGSIADLLKQGIPADTRMTGSSHVIGEADVVTACWLANIESAETPVENLSRKVLDNVEFLRRWSDAGGDLTSESGPEPVPGIQSPSVLSEHDIVRRIAGKNPQRLIVTPLLPGAAKGCGLDVRLGNQFIAFSSSRTKAFDALGTDDPRTMQTFIELPWGDNFVLHPREIVLASTLEYFVFPGDVTAQLITRSSYGRMGLLSATAVQVHPNFHGCLTFELVNLGSVPLVLTPGERIAQLIFSVVSEPIANLQAKYHCAIGPEFSQVRDDTEADVLRKMRSQL